MRKLFLAATVATAVGLVATPIGPVFARGGGPTGGPGVSGFPGGFSQGNKTGWNGANMPPGWTKGNKKGWGTATMPPGLGR